MQRSGWVKPSLPGQFFVSKVHLTSATKAQTSNNLGVAWSSVRPLAVGSFQRAKSGSYLSVSPLCPCPVSKESRPLERLRRKQAPIKPYNPCYGFICRILLNY